MHDTTVRALRKLKDGNGVYLWQPGLREGEPDKLLNHRVLHAGNRANAGCSIVKQQTDGISNAAVRGETIPEADHLTIAEAMDAMLQWFCLVFGNQFTPDKLLDNYPVDRLMHDVALMLMAVQSQTTSILNEFPTKAAQATETQTEKPPKEA